MTLFVSRRLAVVVGVLLPLAETVRRWPLWKEYPPAFLDDFLIGAFLLYGAWRCSRDRINGRIVLRRHGPLHVGWVTQVSSRTFAGLRHQTQRAFLMCGSRR